MRFLLACTLFLLSSPVLAETAGDPSLFFTSKEMDAVDQPDIVQPAPRSVASIHLGAVLYFGPKSWTIWLDGVRWTPTTQRDDLHVLEVEPNLVRIRWQPTPSAAPHLFVLQPYQTYETASGKIVEGQP